MCVCGITSTKKCKHSFQICKLSHYSACICIKIFKEPNNLLYFIRFLHAFLTPELDLEADIYLSAGGDTNVAYTHVSTQCDSVLICVPCRLFYSRPSLRAALFPCSASVMPTARVHPSSLEFTSCPSISWILDSKLQLHVFPFSGFLSCSDLSSFRPPFSPFQIGSVCLVTFASFLISPGSQEFSMSLRGDT